MSSQNYESGKLNSILESLFEKKASGILSLQTQVNHSNAKRSCILMARDGALIYGELNAAKVPSNQDIGQMLGEKLKPDLINAALKVAVDKSSDPSSIRELLELLIRMTVFTWQEVEAFITYKLVLILEQFLNKPGIAKWRSSNDFDLDYGEDRHSLNWLHIQQEIEQRQQRWNSYSSIIPDMYAIPFVTPEQLAKIGDRNVRNHLKESANGRNTLLEIAEKMDKDPLKIAKSYVNWVNNGWVDFDTNPSIQVRSTTPVPKSPELSSSPTIKQSVSSPANDVDGDSKKLPVVLSVDDSAIIQISIKRALEAQYQVLMANKAADALTMLNEHPVQLLLLDLTMPDIDGLEFCKIVRKIDRFQDLPIVMVTARDGLVNKMKGHIAGSSRYLTKPFKPEQLRQVVGEYIK